MNEATWAMLNDAEKELLRQAGPAALAELDEDALADLHDRVRRARNKYSKLYRRRAREQVQADASRAGAHDVHARTLVKAEAFEGTLARVSTSLARAAGSAANAPGRSGRGHPAKSASGRAHPIHVGSPRPEGRFGALRRRISENPWPCASPRGALGE